MPLYLVFYFWLLVVSGLVFALERLFPRRRDQEAIRPGLVQDLFWLVFNTQYLAWMLALASVHLIGVLNTAFLQLGVPSPETWRLIAGWPLWAQFVAAFVVKDFFEWNLHRWMHHVPWLWRFHKLHHSIEQLDWAATFRSHWGEVILNKLVIYLPLVILGVDDRVIFVMLVFSLLLQELSHANLPDWGPLRYVFNSPRFHAWHHDIEMHGRNGQNFGVSLALWDWLFGTAHWPRHAVEPKHYGFDGVNSFPKSWWGRCWEPFTRERTLPEGSARKQAEKTESNAGPGVKEPSGAPHADSASPRS
jgi:sterol desaturase/sphingolipid hydroxylase (fatty acid hydroxylase superfamily)